MTTITGKHSYGAENELDIRGLFRALWSGKHWIIGFAVLFAVIVLIYIFCPARVEQQRCYH